MIGERLVAEISARVPERWREPAGLIALAVVALAAMLLAVRPSWAHLQQQRSTWQALRAQIDNARALESGRAGGLAQRAQVRQQYEQLIARLDADQSVARILEVLSARAQARGLELVAQQTRGQAPEAARAPWGGGLPVDEIPVTIQLTGRYKAVGEFLGWLPDAPFVASVRSVKMQKADASGPRLRADLELVVYLKQKPRTS